MMSHLQLVDPVAHVYILDIELKLVTEAIKLSERCLVMSHGLLFVSRGYIIKMQG